MWWDVLVLVDLPSGAWCKRRPFPLRGDSALGPSRGSRWISPTGCSTDRRCETCLSRRAFYSENGAEVAFLKAWVTWGLRLRKRTRFI